MEDELGSPVRPEKKRIKTLYRRCPAGAAVVCFDEWGPLELRPQGGLAWARTGKAQTMRATYTRTLGTEQFLGFLDVHDDVLSGLFRKRKRLRELEEAFRRLRAAYGRRRLIVIMDNLHQTHDHPQFLALLRELHIEVAWTPTEASWLNLIEPHFGVLKRATLSGTDDRSHVLRRQRIYRYLRWRDRSHGTRGHPLQRLRSIRLNKLELH